MRGRGLAWVAVAPLLGAVACASVWGFDDLTLADGGPRDATTVTDAPVGVAESGEDAEVDATVDDGYDSVDDAGDASHASDVSDTGSYGEGGEGGGPNDGGVKDAGDDGAAAAACKTICMGCCDSTGHCLDGTAMSACGNSGNACEVCPASACPLETPCCGATSKQCGCAAAALICSKN